MNIRLILLLAFLLLGFSPAMAQVKTKSAAAQTATAKMTSGRQHRVVYDVTNADTAVQASLVRQLNNIKRSWPEAQVEVVIHGKGLDFLLTNKSYKAAGIRELQGKGVVFAACENTMRFRKVTKADLLPGVITVPMGVGEIIMKQEEGWSYIKY